MEFVDFSVIVYEDVVIVFGIQESIVEVDYGFIDYLVFISWMDFFFNWIVSIGCNFLVYSIIYLLANFYPFLSPLVNGAADAITNVYFSAHHTD